jgi:hypothetical protein
MADDSNRRRHHSQRGRRAIVDHNDLMELREIEFSQQAVEFGLMILARNDQGDLGVVCRFRNRLHQIPIAQEPDERVRNRERGVRPRQELVKHVSLTLVESHDGEVGSPDEGLATGGPPDRGVKAVVATGLHCDSV